MPGHLFVVRSDLTALTCDAWLVPSDRWCKLETSWSKILPHDLRSQAARQDTAPPDFGIGRHAFAPAMAPPAPLPVISNIGGIPLEDLPKRVVEFLDLSLELRPESSIPGRKVPLFGFPLVGTRHGGWHEEHGDVTHGIVGAASKWVATHEADAAVVLWTPQAFSAAQAARRALALAPGLPSDLAAHAVRLGRRASLGGLVLFLGAGLGYPAGLPLWDELIHQLAADAGIDAKEAGTLKQLDPRDAARIIESRLGDDPDAIGQAIARRMTADRFGLGTALLAGLPVSETVTTNYDTLFERATTAAGRHFAVLPYDQPKGDGWLLKLHGTVDPKHLRDIVLTRGDYLRYADRRAALAGIVQALLITREMLFVGFSLKDENFYRIADDVRKAVGADGDSARKFGTALLLRGNPLLEELWANDLDFLEVADATETGGRNLDIFLDHMLQAASTGASHLLDERFRGVLDKGEQELSDALHRFKQDLPATARTSPAWTVVEDLLKQLGA